MNPDTKHHIDNARQVLVGKVPDPKSQIDQITNALIYKFMDDMDDHTASLGGKRRYFTGDYEKYSWRKLMSESLGAHDRLTLYRQALENMSKNPGIPQLFRDIFRNAYLPFNDARTLTLFLTEINHFSYDNSEELGNGYEYLLSIMGSQGDAGQFRTPRHIIDFIVEAVGPTKDDSVLDPACGTAGFLISAYKHVIAKHDGKDDITGVIEQNTHEIRLSSDDRKKIYANYHGFDIDENMVKMARVNMYLHSFPEPHLIEHDSLSSEDYWNERYDVILANPPFMTPRGGIQPHKKFGIEANRAEVLFVDYIASHLKPTGRAGIIVPEGIIFQSGKAYKELRKNLVENYLYAVVSLPAGVFQPYSGVKTSILLLDKKFAKRCDEILFVKVENDGLSLGAQRRSIAGNQLPEALEIIEQFKRGEVPQNALAHAVKRYQMAENGDYNLSGDRYKATIVRESQAYPLVELGKVAKFINGYGFNKNDWKDSGKPIIRIQNLTGTSTEFNYTDKFDWPEQFKVLPGDLLISWSASIGFYLWKGPEAYLNQHIFNVKINEDIILKSYLYFLKDKIVQEIKKHVHGNTMTHVTRKDFEKIQIPFPPIDIQHKIIAELDGYQKIVNAAETIVQTYKPTIKIEPEWNDAKIGDVANVTSGQSPEGKFYNDTGGGMPFYQGKTEFTDKYIGAPKKWTNYTTKAAERGDILMSVRAPVGPVNIATEKICIGRGLAAIRTKNMNNLDQDYLYEAIRAQEHDFKAKSSGSTFESINRKDIEEIKIPLPSIEIQREIVAELKAEQKLIDANKKLIEIYQEKINNKISEIWGDK